MRIVVISNTLKQAYCSFGIDEEMVVVSHDAANKNSSIPFKFDDTSRLQVGYVGHLYAGRGIELIASIAQQSEINLIFLP